MSFTRLFLTMLTALGGVVWADDEQWALSPLVLPELPSDRAGTSSAIDAFIGAKGELVPRADRRILIRRATFDLIGLPPTPAELREFVSDPRSDAKAFADVVDRLLASPRYGERWARHWMDVVRFAETHGHDEDAVRENAWPYRDYLIRSFNEDKPYAQFVREQVAGDVLYPDDPWATVATSFLACGPWDESSQMGIQDGTVDKLIAQYLDRDEMLTATMSTFTSTTAHCSRCHDHKFDPIPAADYYALQAVFAGVDRVDVRRELDSDTLRRRRELAAEREGIEARSLAAEVLRSPEVRAGAIEWAAGIGASEREWALLSPTKVSSEHGSTLEILADQSVLSGGERPERDTYSITGRVDLEGSVSAIQLEVLTHETLFQNGPGRQDNGNLHLSEIAVFADGVEQKIARSFADFNQAGWGIERAIDGDTESAWGIFPEVGKPHAAVFVLQTPVQAQQITIALKQLHGGGHLIGRPRLSLTASTEPALHEALPASLLAILETPAAERSPAQWDEISYRYLDARNRGETEGFAESGFVYAVSGDFESKGNFKPAKAPRPIHLLERGDVNAPGELVSAGALSCVSGLPARFEFDPTGDEGARRAALGEWLAAEANVLTWRSIANRVWHYHFGRGIVTTPNDFGAMGARPSHPELLDWLAFQLRAHKGSLKWLHREICTSATYAQAASAAGGSSFVTTRKLDAESIRDAVLQLSGKLDLTMGGPSARQFYSSKGVHVTPNLDYLGFDPDDPANFRRGVYRFVFRTVPDPLMAALDCPDASQMAPKREVSYTALQALATMNNRFLVRQCEHIAARLERERGSLPERIALLFELAYSRAATPAELERVGAYATQHGLANACRIIINSSEFVFLQ